MSPDATSFCLLISTLTLTSASKDMTTSDIARYGIVARNYHAPTSTQDENLRIILNCVRREEKFRSSTVTLVSSDVRSNFVGLVSDYIASESIVSYRITTSSVSRMHTWQSRIDLTWVLIVDDADALNSFVHEQSHIWRATNQYLIIITARTVATPSRETFESVWRRYGVYRIVAISIQEDFRCLSGYSPFEKNQRSGVYGVVRRICLTERWNNVELYDDFVNLHGYPVRVTVFQSVMMKVRSEEGRKFDGLDANAMSLLEEATRAEFRVDVIVTSRDDDPFHRALRYIENGESDLIVTSFFIHEYKEYRRYEFAASIYEDKLCLIAPTAGFVPKSYMPILPFAPDLWAALAVYNLLVSVLWFLVKYYSVSFRRRRGAILLPLMETTRFLPRRADPPPRVHPYVSSCFDLVEIWCYPLKEDGGSAGGTAAQRALLFGALFFGLIITGLYQSCLVSGLSEPFRYPELDTLEDVANSNFTIITKYPNLKENTFAENTSLSNRLKDKIEMLFSETPTNDMVAFNGNVIAIGRYASHKLENLSRYYDEDGNELLHIVEECPITYLLSYVVRLHSPYRERIDELLLRMQAAGLVGLWYKNMTYPMYVDEQRRKVDRSDRRVKLTMEHYSLTFLGLSFGLLSCVVVFVAELYFAKRLG